MNLECFIMHKFKNGNTVAILTSEGKHSPITGNLKLFRDISTRLTDQGMTTIVITPSSLDENRLKKAYILNKDHKKWVLVEDVDIPSIIYNRIPYRKDEKTSPFQQFKDWCQRHSIEMFNERFFSKSDIFQTLTKHPFTNSFLPDTQMIKTNEQLESFLNQYSSLYLKPNDGSKGNGIFVLSKLENETYILKGHHDTFGSSSLLNIWEKKIKPLISKKDYIVQQHIPLAKYDDRYYDFRILAHKPDRQWVVSGIGVRQSKTNGITTHVLKGGNSMNLNDAATPFEIKQLIQITTRCGKQLEKKLGNIREFSMDVGKTADRKFYIFDINSKPMKFDEADIYESGMKNLIQLFLN